MRDSVAEGSNIFMHLCVIKQSSSSKDEGAKHLRLLLVFFMSLTHRQGLKGLGGVFADSLPWLSPVYLTL